MQCHCVQEMSKLYADPWTKNNYFNEGSSLTAQVSLFLRCAAKTHAESVAESMGNYVDSYSDKKRGLDIDAIGNESHQYTLLHSWAKHHLTRSLEAGQNGIL